MKHKKKLLGSIAAIFLATILALSPLASLPMVGASEYDLYVYGEYVPDHSVYAIEGYGDLLYYDDGTGVCHIIRVTIPAGADPDVHPNNPEATGEMAPRTFTEIEAYNFKADTGWSGGQKAEFYVSESSIYYGSVNGIEVWDKNPDGTFDIYSGRLEIPSPNKGTTLAYDTENDTWYTCTSSRSVYSFRVGIDAQWQYEFTYPSYDNGHGHHGGMEFVGGYLWVSEMSTDYIGQWVHTTANGWQEVKSFSYIYRKNVEGLGFGPLGHFWAGAGGWKKKGKSPPIYEIGGGSVQVDAEFSWIPEPQNEAELISFADASTSWPDSIVSWSWDFNDDSVADSTALTPLYAYGDNGTYPVNLTVTNSNGAENTVTQFVTVNNAAPDIVSSGGSTSGYEGTPITLTVTAMDPGSDDLTFTWDWGDGTSATETTYYNEGIYPFSATDSAEHVYGDNGDYTMTLTVADDDGGAVSIEFAITVLNVAPGVDALSYQGSSDEGAPISFTITATDQASDDLSLTWDWGDGTLPIVTTYYNDGIGPDPGQSPQGISPFSTTNTVEHTYGDDGEYIVTLTVADDDGGVTTDTIALAVINGGPAVLSASYEVDAGNPAEGSSISFSGSAEDPGTDDLTFGWGWDDGTSPTVTTYYNDGVGPDPDQSPQGIYPFSATDSTEHVYGDNGTYTVNLTMTDDDGGAIIFTIPVTVLNVTPTAETWGDQIGNEGIPIDFTAAASDPGSDDLTFTWDWGDGASATETTYYNDVTYPFSATNLVYHSYGDDGVYNVTLTVADDDGGVTTHTLSVTVRNVAPAVEAGPDQGSPAGETVCLSASFTDPGWLDSHEAAINWGDGTVNSMTVPVGTYIINGNHTYEYEGIYSVSVSIWDDELWMGRDTLTIYIPVGMTVSVDPSEVPSPSDVQYIQLHDIPLQNIPLQDIPLQDIPLQDISVGASPLQDIPLQDIPLQDISWESILMDTPLQDIPLQDITLGELLLSGIPLQDITLADIFLAGIPLQDISIGAAPLQDIPLQDIPLQDITWESILVDTPLQDIPLQDISLRDLLLADVPLQDIPLQDINIVGTPLEYIPLQDIPLQDITWESILIGTPLQDIPLQDITLGDLVLNNIPLQDITLQDILLARIPLQDIPLQDIPLQDINILGTPLQDIPLQDIPLQDIPLQDIDISGTPLQDIPLQDIPLQDITWESILMGTPLQDIPLQDITLGDLVLENIPLQDITLRNILLGALPLQDISLQDITILGTPLQDIPLQDIPLQDITWESILMGTPLQDIPLQDITLGDLVLENIPLQDITLEDILLAGIPLQDIPLQDITLGDLVLASLPLQDITLQDVVLAGVPLQDIPLQDIPLQDITIVGTPLQDIPLQDIPLQDITWESILIDTPLQDIPLQDITLGDLVLAGIPLQDITLEDIVLAGVPLQDIPLQDIPILDTPLQDIPLQDISADWESILAGTIFEGTDLETTTLGDIALAVIPLQDITLWDALMAFIPLQDIPWESIPLQDIPLQETFETQNAVTYTVTVANYGNMNAEDVVITFTLPDGFTYLDGSTTGAITSDPVIDGQNMTWESLTVVIDTELVLEFKAIASLSLGTYFSSASATSSNVEIPPAIHTAPVTVADTFESNDTWQQAADIAADCLYLSYISSETDVDWYRIPVPDDRGTMVTVHLSHLPDDYDLVVFAGTEALPTDLELQSIPLQDIPLQDIPLQDIPLQDIPLQDIPLQDIPLQDIPLQDIPLQDIPLQDISLERGTTDETAGDKVVNETGYYYILVSGYNDAHSNEPYVLRIEITPPPPIELYSRDLPPAGDPGTPYEPYGTDTETLIVINQQRLGQYYEDATTLLDKLVEFADLANVNGMILPVDFDESVRDAYTAWDANAGDPEAANAVAAAIRLVINDALDSHPNIQYLVIVGSDEIVPFYRVPDEVYLSNESTYAAHAHLEPGALYASLVHGYILTDDYYADKAPVPWMGRELYVPDYAIGRLVETPDEITGTIQEFINSNGILDVDSALVTGYDFLTDGAEAIVDALTDQGLIPEELISEDWTAAELLAELLTNPAYDLISINAHCNHWQVGPPVGSPLQSNQVLASYLAGSLVFSMGCHSGLNVDDAVSEPGDWSLDLPQAFASEAAWFVGNTGYGYGDSDIVALSEELMRNFATALGAEDSVPVGQALLNAKHEYFLNMGAYGPFDEKIMIESTLYGLPMYQVRGISVSLPEVSGIPLVIDANRYVGFVLVDSLQTDAQLIATTTDDGVYYTADGATQFIAYRPVQPKTSMPVSYPGQVAHGALFTGGTYEDMAGFDPVIARPIDDQSLYEPQIINEAWYPSKVQTIISLETAEGASQALVVTPGQFITTSADTTVIGTERLYTSLSYDIYYSNSEDYAPPMIELADVTIREEEDSSFTAYFSVVATDADDTAIPDDGRVRRVIVTWTYISGDTTWETIDLEYDALSGTWAGELPGLNGTDTDFIVQAVDDAGNVGFGACKGFFYTPIPVEAGDDQTVQEGTVVDFQGSIGQSLDSLSVVWDFGDGSIAEDTLNPTHVYNDNGVYTVALRVMDGRGGSGWDTLEVTVDNAAPAVEVPAELTVQYTESLYLAGSFSDLGLGDTHMYRWEFSAAQSSSDPLITIWANLEVTIDWLAWLGDYPAPESYIATLTVEDDDGGIGVGTCLVNITKQDTSTAVYTSVNPSVLSQVVTFTATVTTSQPDASPTGNVTFVADGTTTLGTVPLSTIDGVTTASLSTSSLSVGNHIITATYSGDSIYNGSSSSLTQAVVYKFGGFLQPIPNSQYESGRNIPVKFILTDYNDVNIGTATATVSVNGGPALGTAKYNNGQYSYNLKTKDLPLGELVISVSLDDGVNYSVTVILK